MFLQRSVALGLIFLIIFLLLPMNVISQSKRLDQKVTKGKVIQISRSFVTVGSTTIALPPRIKAFDIDGNSISFETVKKGDHVSVRLNKNEAIVKKVSHSGERKSEEIVPK